jgi:hypothetical protein
MNWSAAIGTGLLMALLISAPTVVVVPIPSAPAGPAAPPPDAFLKSTYPAPVDVDTILDLTAFEYPVDDCIIKDATIIN